MSIEPMTDEKLDDMRKRLAARTVPIMWSSHTVEELIARVDKAEAIGPRLLNILGRASNVVEISWSLPASAAGSMMDTLLAAIEELRKAIAPPENDAGTRQG